MDAHGALQPLVAQPPHPLLLGRINVIDAHYVIVLQKQVVGAVDVVKADQMGALHLLDTLTARHITGIVYFVMAELGHTTALRLRVQEFIGLIQIVAHRLLNEDVLPRSQCVRRRLGMVLRQHHHRIQIGAFQHLTIVGKYVPDSVLGPNGLHRARRQVAQGRNLKELRQLEQMRQMHNLGDHSCSDQTDSYWTASHG